MPVIICSLSLLKNVKYSYQQVQYLNKLLNKKYSNAIAKLKLSPHPLLIETERYCVISQENRTCNYYDIDDIEDDIHFVRKCPKYTFLRNTYIPKHCSRNHNMHKFIELLN